MDKTPSQEYRDELAFQEALDHARSYLLGWQLIGELKKLDIEYQNHVDDDRE